MPPGKLYGTGALSIKVVNAFYESAVGQKVISTLPQVMQESMKVGQEWPEDRQASGRSKPTRIEKRENRTVLRFLSAAFLCPHPVSRAL
jgi:hypothetical protein